MSAAMDVAVAAVSLSSKASDTTWSVLAAVNDRLPTVSLTVRVVSALPAAPTVSGTSALTWSRLRPGRPWSSADTVPSDSRRAGDDRAVVGQAVGHVREASGKRDRDVERARGGQRRLDLDDERDLAVVGGQLAGRGVEVEVLPRVVSGIDDTLEEIAERELGHDVAPAGRPTSSASVQPPMAAASAGQLDEVGERDVVSDVRKGRDARPLGASAGSPARSDRTASPKKPSAESGMSSRAPPATRAESVAPPYSPRSPSVTPGRRARAHGGVRQVGRGAVDQRAVDDERDAPDRDAADGDAPDGGVLQVDAADRDAADR